MRICKNKVTDTIREHFDANPLKVPESRMQPLSILEIKNQKMNYLGSFPDLIQGDFDFSLEIETSDVSKVNNTKTQKADFNFSLSILENLLKAFNIDGGSIKGAFKNSKTMSFSFANVQRHYIDGIRLGKILSENQLKGDPNNFFIKNILQDQKTKLALVTDVIVSNNFSISTYKEGEQEAEIDIPVIEKYIGDLHLDTTCSQTSINEIKFTGATPLTFAFSCVEIKIDLDTHIFSRGEWIENIRSKRGGNNLETVPIIKGMEIDDKPASPLLWEYEEEPMPS